MIKTWTCEICGRKKEDSLISVMTYFLKGLPGAERNLKYCNDIEECLQKAREKAKTGEM